MHNIAEIRRKTNAFKLHDFWADIRRDKYLYLLLVPSVLFFALFAYRPLWGLRVAFFDYSPYKGIEGSAFVGLKYFKEFLTGAFFGRLLSNTLIISLYGIIFNFFASVVLALLLNEVRIKWFSKMVQTITYIPYFVSVVVVAGMVTNFLAPTGGIVNILIQKFGGESIYFLTKSQYFRPIYVIMNLWKDTGFNAIIFLAALSSVDVQLYEACYIDGGGKWKQMLHVTLPGIMPTIIIMLIMRIGGILDIGYEAIILLYQPATYETADVINTYVYRIGLVGSRYGLATAVGLFNSLVSLLLVWASNSMSKKLTQTSLW